MQTRPSSITGSWTRALRTSKSLSLQRHSGEECGRYWIHCRRHRGAVARILVMDDDGMLRGAIRIALEAARYEVLEAADGHAGLRLQREQGADLVLVDIFMPERDGLEVIRALRAEHPQPTIVAMSGGGRTGPIEVLEAAAALGASRTLVKPFEPRQLLKVIRELLGERAASGPGRRGVAKPPSRAAKTPSLTPSGPPCC